MKIAVKKAVNSRGVVIAVVVESNIYGVYKLESPKQWKPMKAGMDRLEAFRMFDKAVAH